MRDKRMPLGQIAVLLLGMMLILIISLSHCSPPHPMFAFMGIFKPYSLYGDIYTYDLVTGKVRSISGLIAATPYVEWSPDGTQIAYPQGEVYSGVFVVDVISGESHKLITNKWATRKISWSPDSQHIAYVTSPNQTEVHLYVINRDGSQPRDLAIVDNTYHTHQYTWSPDSKYIVFTTQQSGELYRVDIENGLTKQLTFTPNHKSDPDWSPDGINILFTTYSAQDRMSQIGVMNADGGNLRTIFSSQDIEPFIPRWSPNGQRIAFVDHNNRDLYVMDADGQNVHQIATEEQGYTGSFAWSPNSETLLILGDHDSTQSNSVFYIIDADGRNLRRLPVEITAGAPTWRR